MAQDMSIKRMRLMSTKTWSKMNQTQRNKVKKSERTEIGQFCKYGYTQYSLWLCNGDLIFCEGYTEYCDIQHSL